MIMLRPTQPRCLRHAFPREFKSLAALLLMAAVWASPGSAATLPTGFIETQVGGSWNEAVGLEITSAGRIFVSERGGRVWTVDGGVKSPAPFIDIAEEVGGWRDFGLLGFALHPNFLNNGYVYLYYVVDRHHLLNFGDRGGPYVPATNEYYAATQGRITRYTAIKGSPSDPDFSNATSVDYASRLVIHGDEPGTGCAILYESHGTGHLVFGNDGTLLAACGDGASYSTTDVGSVGHTYYVDAIADGIMRPDENVGAYRSQMLTSLSGKILRLDPITGHGVPSNPFFEPGDPNSTRSKVWSLGLRNPYRMTLKPGTGSHDPTDGDPGILYIGDVGWGTWEDLHVANAPGQNFGWPAFEGLEAHGGYWSAAPQNQAAPNPLYDGSSCTLQYFLFTDLIQQATLDPSADFPNPCDGAQQITTTPTFFHARPKIDMRHGATGGARWGSFNGFDAIAVDVGTAQDPGGKSVPGPLFGSNTSTAGVFYTGTQFPPEYQGQYLHAEWDHEWIKVFEMDSNDEPVRIDDFVDNGGGIVFVDMDPTNGDLYYISWTAQLYKVQYIGGGNAPPTAVASADVTHSAGNLTNVQFTGDQSTDPESGTLTYDWEFPDDETSTLANPMQSFSSPPATPTRHTITLTVTDDGAPAESDTTTLYVWTRNTPPLVDITSPVDGSLYSVTSSTQYSLDATISDAQSLTPTLGCEWIVALHHNDHFHSDPPVSTCTGALTEIPALGCDPNNTYWFAMTLTVTDEQGLSTEDRVEIFPDEAGCPNVAPLAINDAADAAKGLATDLDVVANDFDSDGSIDPSTVLIIDPPIEGSIGGVDPVTGVVTYLAPAGSATSDSFTYTVDDNDGDASNVATVLISLVNDPPTVTLTSPVDGATFTPADSIAFSAIIDDADDVASLLAHWEIDGIVNGVVSPAIWVHDGTAPPSWTVPSVGGPDDHVSYRLTLTVTDAAGDVAVDVAWLYPATLPPGLPPLPSFTATPDNGAPPLVVDFDASATTDPDADLLQYHWDFGDGSTATGPLAQHTYTGYQIYFAVLTVTDAIGQASSAAHVIDTSLYGAVGEYYDDIALTDPVTLVRVDPVIDFDWGNGSPDPLIPNNSYSARWTGQIVPLYSESYTFYISIDDGGRLWLDDVLVIDSWVDQGETEHPSAAIPVTADTPVSFRFEWYENGGSARARLRWSSPSQPKQIIPASQLQGVGPSNAPPIATGDSAGYDLAASVQIDVLANDVDDQAQLDPSSVVLGAALHGSVSFDPGTGIVTYTHDGSPTTTDAFSYSVDDLDANTSNLVAVSLSLDPTCGDGLIVGPEDCEDGNALDGDCCSAACTFEIAGSSCDDADACTLLETCDGSGACAGGGPVVCSDALFCNGLETCDSGSGCVAGSPPVVSDGVGCTDDSCDEGADVVVHAVNHPSCGDGLFCNGAEICDAVSDCGPGAPPTLDDGVDCTDDSCDEALDVVVHSANDATCDDLLFCNGAEYCDAAADCQAGTPPVLSDGVDCTIDGCDEGLDLVVHSANDAFCDDGAYCNGDEICDIVSDCQPGTARNADDGVACTVDGCDEIGDQIVNTPDDLQCDDFDSCTADACDGVLGCTHDPIPGCTAAVPVGSLMARLALVMVMLAAGALALRGRREERA